MLLVALMAAKCTDAGGDSSIEPPDTGVDWCPERAAPELEDAWTTAGAAPGGDLFFVVEAGGVAYAASTMNGLYRSLDGGTWEKLPTAVTHMQGQVAVDPDDPDHLGYISDQLIWSQDGGRTSVASGWPELAPGSPAVRGLVHDGAGFVALTDDGAVYRVAIDEEPVQLGAIDAAPPHGYDGGLFEPHQGWWFLASGDEVLFAAQQWTAVHRSTDGGATWAPVTEASVQITAFGADGQRAWYGEGERLVHSDDAGASWTEVPLGVDVQGAAWAGDVYVVASGDGLFRVEDGAVVSGGELPDVHDLRYVGATSSGVVAVHRDGAFRSQDAGASWQDASAGLEVTDLGPLLAHPGCASVVWVGTTCERGLFESVEGWGEGLRRVDEYLHYVMVPRARGRELWVTTDNTLKRSGDLGVSWETVAPEVIDVHVHGLALRPGDPSVVVTGTVGSGEVDQGDDVARILRSQDGGETWAATTGVPASDTSIHALHFVDRDVALAGTWSAGDYVHRDGEPGIGILRSTDGGQSWTLDADTALSVPVFDQCGDRVFAASEVGVLTSDDAGLTWDVSASSTRPFLAVACHQDVVLALSEDGIVRSSDAGETWTDYSEGLHPSLWPSTMMPQLDISADGSIGYAAVPGEGLLRRPL